MTATPPASWISSIACCGGRPAARDEGLGAGHQVLLEEGAEVAGRAGRPGDVRAADRVGGAGLADRVLEGQVEALAAQVLDDLPGPGRAAPAGPARRPARSSPGRPSSRRCAGLPRTRARRTSRSPAPARPPAARAASAASGDPGDRVVVGQRQRRHPGLRRLPRRPRPAPAARRRRSNDSAARSTSDRAAYRGLRRAGSRPLPAEALGAARSEPTPACRQRRLPPEGDRTLPSAAHK